MRYTILIGTQNRAKQQDFLRSITTAARQQRLNIDLIFPQDLSIDEDIEENGSTFAENSEQKVRFYFKKANIPTISDDGGITIPILGKNIPGVYTKRWAGENASDKERVDFTLKQLAPYSRKVERTTFFLTCLSYFDGTRLIQTTGKTKGYIARHPFKNNPTKDFPYRSLFVLPNGKYYDELTPEEHETYNHRDQAVRKLLDKISVL